MFKYFILCFLAFIPYSEQNSGEALCNQLLKMSDYCAAEQGIPHRVGRVGKAGPRGPQGPPGRTGTVDYSRLRNMIDEELQESKRIISSLEELLTWYPAPNGYRYKVFEDRVTYQAARQRCADKGARLVTSGIRDSSIRGFLKQLMQVKNVDVWIGANDIAREGTFVWEDGTISNGDDIEWSKGQPDNGGGREDCAHYRPRYGWLVNDDPCGSQKMYMCEGLM